MSYDGVENDKKIFSPGRVRMARVKKIFESFGAFREHT
jgi:hypothetical protein